LSYASPRFEPLRTARLSAPEIRCALQKYNTFATRSPSRNASRKLCKKRSSGKENIQRNGPDQDRDRQRLRPLPPHQVMRGRLGREGVHQAHQLRLGPRFRHQAHQHGHNKVG